MAVLNHGKCTTQYDLQRSAFLVAGLACGIRYSSFGSRTTVVRIQRGRLRSSSDLDGWVGFFDVASSPTASPFTYASALLGTTILLSKVIEAAIT